MEILVDADNAVAGRLASYVAKKALEGNKVDVIKSEKAIITGKAKEILKRYIEKMQLGKIAQKGPMLPKKSEMILRRMIRGMLPWKRTTGREAYRRIKCYFGVPEEFQNKEAMKFKHDVKTKYMTLNELSKLIGKR